MHNTLLWSISLVSIALMLIRPFGKPEVIWAGGGAALLILFRLIPLQLAGHAVAAGADVYFFLTGMMVLSELARLHGVFDWLASTAIRLAKGSRTRLFTLLYCIGTVVTVFMSNDATAVVLTPAVLAAVKKSKAEPLPYLLICALIANAASFVLPISNPANLVVFRGNMPPLPKWLGTFAFASVLSIAATYFLLRWYCRGDLSGRVEGEKGSEPLSAAGKLMLLSIALVAVVLLIASALGKDLGLPTLFTVAVVALFISVRERTRPQEVLRHISWSVLPLVAALFVLVEATENVGALRWTTQALHAAESSGRFTGSMAASFAVGVAANFLNNLPLGLIAGATVQATPSHWPIANAVLIATDLGPNLSVTGSLATILWLIAIRREGLDVSFWSFLKVGLIVMPPALALATMATAFISR
ncbi:MAG: arsenic transporter [Bryobacteraceae bacterium]